MPEHALPERRQLGASGPHVSSVSLGTWPMAGTSSTDANDKDSIATIRSCAELGINFIDTAYCYGPHGESENLIRQAIHAERDSYVIASKCGIHYNAAGQQEQDARPETILRECNESLQRLGTDRIDLYYLHSPDPQVALAESAGAIAQLISAGKVLAAGLSNAHLPQLKEFHAACPVIAVQLPYNMLQRGIETQTIPWCQERGIAVVVYWALMKGLLAGHITRDQPLAPTDKRLKYPMFQGAELEKNLLLIDQLRAVAEDAGRTVAQVVVNWTVHQPGITTVLCGAKRPWQLADVAGTMGWRLNTAQLAKIDTALAERGQAEVNRVFQ